MITKKHIFIFVQIFISLTLLLIWLKFVNLSEVLRVLPKLNPFGLLLSVIFFFIGSLFRLWRWELLLRPKVKVPFSKLFYISFVSFFINTLVPLRTGEISKSVVLKKRYNVPFSVTFPTVLIDRIIEFIIIASVALFAAFFLLRRENFLHLGFEWVLLIVFSPLAGLFLLTRFNNFFQNLTEKIFFTFFRKPGLSAWVKSFIEGFLVLHRSVWLLTFLIILSLLALAADGASFFFLFAAFGIYVPFFLVTAASAWFFLIFIIPAAPGQIGTTELGGTFVFTTFLGLGTGTTAAVVLINHALGLLISIFVGSYSLQKLGLSPFKLLNKKLLENQ